MEQLGTGWARGLRDAPKHLKKTSNNNAFRRIDIAGVASSILATPTIKSLGSQWVPRLFCFIEDDDAARHFGLAPLEWRGICSV